MPTTQEREENPIIKEFREKYDGEISLIFSCLKNSEWPEHQAARLIENIVHEELRTRTSLLRERVIEALKEKRQFASAAQQQGFSKSIEIVETLLNENG